jgi:hypothetical protein
MPKRKIIPPKNKEKNNVLSENKEHSDLLKEVEYLRAEVAFLKKLAALVREEESQRPAR